MASSINASTTAGVVTTADTSGVLNIQTAGTTAIAIDASQAVSFTNSPTVTGGTANGVAYLNGSKVLTTGSALVFDGTNLRVGTTSDLSAADRLTVVGGNIAVQRTSGITTFIGDSTQTGYAGTITNHAFALLTNSVERARFNTTGALVFAGGTTTANGIGITFPATQSASSDANTLDDYEEGTWTPIDSSGASLTFTGASGTYVKIGSLCYITGSLTFPSTASGANVTIGGLPFNPSGSTQYNNYGPPIRNNKSLSMQVFGVDNTTFILLPIGNYTTYVANSAMTSGAMLFSFTYRTA